MGFDIVRKIYTFLIVGFIFLQMINVSSALANQIVEMSPKEFARFMEKQKEKKKVSILIFFETWIPECKTQAQNVNKIFRRYVKKDVMVYGVSFSGVIDNGLKNWVSNNHIRFPIIVTDEKVASQYSVARYPYICVVDFYGDIVKRYIGGVSYEKMADYLDKLLKELKKKDEQSA